MRDTVLSKTIEIEGLLKQLGGDGRGISSYVNSLPKHFLDDALIRDLRFVASIRNQAAHQKGFSLENLKFKHFVIAADASIQRLKELTPVQRSVPNEPSSVKAEPQPDLSSERHNLGKPKRRLIDELYYKYNYDWNSSIHHKQLPRTIQNVLVHAFVLLSRRY